MIKSAFEPSIMTPGGMGGPSFGLRCRTIADDPDPHNTLPELHFQALYFWLQSFANRPL
jgi:hypothetical protein